MPEPRPPQARSAKELRWDEEEDEEEAAGLPVANTSLSLAMRSVPDAREQRDHVWLGGGDGAENPFRLPSNSPRPLGARQSPYN